MNYQEMQITQALHYLVSHLEGRVCDRATLLALVFLADRYHLRKYGRLMIQSRYKATPDGPVNILVDRFLQQMALNLQQ